MIFRRIVGGLAAPAIALLMAFAPTPACAEPMPIFEDPTSNRTSLQSGGNGPLAHITVDAPTAINQIGVMAGLSAAGNLKFVIYNFDTASFDFVSEGQSFEAGAADFKMSGLFDDVVLLPGVHYFIGAISDVPAEWACLAPYAPTTQNGITNWGQNGNIQGFDDPSFLGTSSAQLPIRLYGRPVPEPTTLAIGAVSILAYAGTARFRRRRA